MTQTNHGPQEPQAHGHGHGHAHDHHEDPGLAELLDLDALVLGGVLDEIATRVADLATTPPRTVVDLGAGTGTGTLALARAMPTADVVAVDLSTTMLARVRAAAQEAGVAERVRTVEADLDGAWPVDGPVDVVWAALSLHHAAAPGRLLRAAHDALVPGGLVAVVEMDALPRFLPDDVGLGEPGLEARTHALSGDAGWNDHPDWTATLVAAGLEVLERRVVTIEVGPDHASVAAYARAQLARVRRHLADRLDPADLDVLDTLLAADGPHALHERSDLAVRAERTVWIARRPAAAPDEEKVHDVVVVGGGAAGLSAAVTLGRSRRDVVVVDAGEPRNAPADHAHNLLAREGTPPRELLAAGRREAVSYGVEVRPGLAVTARRDGAGFVLGLADGAELRARRLVLATGLVDELPDVPGVREAWGGTVLHCPYCHGWEVRDQRVAILGTGPAALHQALLFRQLTEHVTVLAHTMPPLDDDGRATLAALGVPVVTGLVDHLALVDGAREDGSARPEVRAVVLDDGREIEVDAVVVAPRFVARGDLYEQLGGTLTEHPMGSYVEAGPMGRTDVPGVWTAGNTANLQAMVGGAAASGVNAGAEINADLVAEDARAAVAARLR